MSNCIFGWPIRSDVSVQYTPVLSGGSWQSDLPLTNLQDRRLHRVARSTDVLAASTQFDIDLGVARDLRVFAILVLNATSAATVRVRLSNVASDFATPVYDSTAVAILPTGLTAEQLEGMNVWKTIVASADQAARYVRVEIADTSNPDGYVDVARVVIASGWQPSINMAQGASVGLESATVREETDGGAAVFTEKATRRTLQFTIPNISQDEAFGSAFDMQRIVGLAGQIHFVFDPDDTTHMHRRAMLCTLRRLTAIEYPFANYNSVPFELVEEL